MMESNMLHGNLDSTKYNPFNDTVPVTAFHASVAFSRWLESISVNKGDEEE